MEVPAIIIWFYSSAVRKLLVITLIVLTLAYSAGAALCSKQTRHNMQAINTVMMTDWQIPQSQGNPLLHNNISWRQLIRHLIKAV